MMLKRILGVIWDILEIIIIIYVIFVTACILFRNDYGYTQFNKYTLVNINKEDAKYIKNANNGDLLIVKKADNIKKGDNIYYYATVNEHYVIRTGTVTKVTKDNYSSLYNIDTIVTGNKETKSSVENKRVLGEKANNIGVLGNILNFLENKTGFLLFVLLPIMLVFIYQIYVFVILLRYERNVTIEEVKKDTEEKEKRKNNNKKDTEI